MDNYDYHEFLKPVYSQNDLIHLLELAYQDRWPSQKKKVWSQVLQMKRPMRDIGATFWYMWQVRKTFNPIYGLGLLPTMFDEAMLFFKQMELEQSLKEAVRPQDLNVTFPKKLTAKVKSVPPREPKHIDLSSIFKEEEDE